MMLGAAMAVVLAQAPLPPQRPGDQAQPKTAIVTLQATAFAPARGPLPRQRPQGRSFGATGTVADPAPAPNLRLNEMVCRDPRLRGDPRPTVVGHMPGCGILNPVRVTEISGIKLSTPATLDCRTARAFANWVTGVATPAATEILGRRLTNVKVVGSYTCRTRNHKPGAKLSEHAKGHAVDVAGVTLGDGRKISVLKDWGKGRPGQFLRRIWKQACGPFKTVIGPDGDKYHQDHLHLDTALRRSSYCR
ncbi:MAG: extensin family protein [Pseudomonadota bacterium]